MACWDTDPYLCTYDSGGGKDYSNTATWEAVCDVDLSGYGVLVLECYDSQEHTIDVTHTLSLGGATGLDADHRREVRAASGLRVRFASVSSGARATLNEDYSMFVGLVFRAPNDQYGVYINNKTRCGLVRCVIDGVHYSSMQALWAGINLWGPSCFAYECIVRDVRNDVGDGSATYCSGILLYGDAEFAQHVVSCTILGVGNTSTGYGIFCQDASGCSINGYDIINCYAADCVQQAFKTYGDVSYHSGWNAADDTSASGACRSGGYYKNSIDITAAGSGALNEAGRVTSAGATVSWTNEAGMTPYAEHGLELPPYVLQTPTEAIAYWFDGLGTDQSHADDVNIRIAIRPSQVKNYGDRVKIVIKAHSSNDTVISGCSIGPIAGSFGVFDYTSTPTRVTFDTGNNGCTISAGTTKESDWITFDFTDPEQWWAVHFFLDDAGTQYYTRGQPGSSVYFGTYVTNLDSDDTLTENIDDGSYTDAIYTYLLEQILVDGVTGTTGWNNDIDGVTRSASEDAVWAVGASELGPTTTSTTTTTTTSTTTTATTTTVIIRDTQVVVEVADYDSTTQINDTQVVVQALGLDETEGEVYTTQIVIQSLEANTTSTTSHFWEEDFSGMGTGSPPDGWTEEWSTAPATTVEAVGKDKSLAIDISANARIAVTDDPIDKADMEVLALVQAKDAFATLAGGVGVRISGGVGTETGYVLFLDCANNRIVLYRYNNGVSAQLSTHNHIGDIEADHWYWLRLRVSDDTIMARVWGKHDAEPGTWGIDYTDGSPVTGRGGAGVCTYNADAYCDYFAADGDSGGWPIPQPDGYLTTTSTTTTTTTHTTTTTTTVEVGATYWTAFGEYSADAAPGDWTEVWEAPVAAVTVREEGQYENKYLEIDHSTFGHYLATWDEVGNVCNVDVLAKVKFADTVPVSGQDYFRIVVRKTGTTGNKNGYEVRVYPSNDQLKVYKWVSNVASQRGPTDSFTIGSAWYWLRFRVRGDAIKVRVWAGQPSDEPGTWDIETTDTSHSGVYGAVGVGSYNGDDTRVDYFAVGVGNEDAPAPADYLTTTTTTTTTTHTTTTGTTSTEMLPPWYAATATLQG